MYDCEAIFIDGPLKGLMRVLPSPDQFIKMAVPVDLSLTRLEDSETIIETKIITYERISISYDLMNGCRAEYKVMED